MRIDKRAVLLLPFVWAFFSIAFRDVTAVDESRYLTVAWEMWINGNFVVPTLNGEFYSHKPPLLFWFTNILWLLGGVDEFWGYLVQAFFSSLTIWIVYRLDKLLFPKEDRYSPLILASFFSWFIYSIFYSFDVLLTCIVTLNIYLLVKIVLEGSSKKSITGYLLTYTAGILAKGPVFLIFALPPVLFIKFWRPREEKNRIKVRTLLLASLGGILLVFVWVYLVFVYTDPSYLREILISQHLSRVHGDKPPHDTPWWGYIVIMPFLLLPYSVKREFWKEVSNLFSSSNDWRKMLLSVWIFIPFLIFTFIPSKRPHYLLPILPAFALLIGKIDLQVRKTFWFKIFPVVLLPSILKFHFTDYDFSNLSLLSGVMVFTIMLISYTYLEKSFSRLKLPLLANIFYIALLAFILPSFAANFSPRKAAELIGVYESQGYEIAFVGRHHGEFGFLGRLKKPLVILTENSSLGWLDEGTKRMLVVTEAGKYTEIFGRPPDIKIPYRSRHIGIWLSR